MSDSAEAPSFFKSLIQQHNLIEAGEKICSVAQFANTHSDEDMVATMLEGEGPTFEGMVDAARKLTQFMVAVMKATHNAVMAIRDPGKSLAPNEFPALLTDVRCVVMPPSTRHIWCFVCLLDLKLRMSSLKF
jgi:hypothetical protein